MAKQLSKKMLIAQLAGLLEREVARRPLPCLEADPTPYRQRLLVQIALPVDGCGEVHFGRLVFRPGHTFRTHDRLEVTIPSSYSKAQAAKALEAAKLFVEAHWSRGWSGPELKR